MLGLGYRDGAGAKGEKVIRGVDLVEPQQGHPAVVGIAPAGANRTEGVGEVSFQDIDGSVGGGAIEVARNESGAVGKGGVFVEKGESEVEFGAALDAVLAVLLPA